MKTYITLTVSVIVDLNGTSPEEIKTNLETLVQYGSGEGMITGDSAAELVELDYTAEVVDPPATD